MYQAPYPRCHSSTFCPSFLYSNLSYWSYLLVYTFSVYWSFTSLVKITPRYYYILVDAIVNEIVFLISLFDSLLLVIRNATDVCILILYSITLLNLSIHYKFCVCVWSLGIYIYSVIDSIVSPAHGDSFNSSFPIRMPFSFLA